MQTKVKQAKVEQAESQTTDAEAASKNDDESGAQVYESPIAIAAVKEWMAQRSFNEKLTAVLLWQLARIENVLEGPDNKIGNDLYNQFNEDILGETEVPADCELIRGVYAAWQIMPA